MKRLILAYSVLLILISCSSNPIDDLSEEVTGEYYDWTTTMAPEQAWNHDYNQTLVSKFFLCERDGEGKVKEVFLTFEEALEVIRKLDNITLGIPKIAYLVGWQYNGHDSKYPAWDKVNSHLKRTQDSTALESLKWLIQEAKKHHTTVSLHLNMVDAFEESPLWASYLEKDIIAKDSLGNPIKGEVFSGMQSYQISYAQEWKLGYTQKRIDALLNMLPELEEGGTIHVDAFHSMRPSGPEELISPYLGYSLEEELEAQRKIIRYWRSKGLDFTSEAGIYWLRKDPFIGLQAMGWHYTEANYLKEDWLHKPDDFKSLPLAFSAYTPMQCEQEIKKDPTQLKGLIEQVSLRLIPWYYKRNPDIAQYSNVIITDDIVICPILWGEPALIVYSSENDIIDMPFRFPSNWGDIAAIQVNELSLEGLRPLSIIELTDTNKEATSSAKTLRLNAKKGVTLVLKPIEKTHS